MYTYQKNNKLSPEQIVDFTKQLLTGIHFIHTKKYIHTDIKPNNILILSNMKLKISDFGSCQTSTNRGKYQYLQTMPYQAPEV